MRVSISQLLVITASLRGHLAAASQGQDLSGEPQLKYEHPGSIFKTVSADSCCVNGVVRAGNSTGQTKTVGGITMYIAPPPTQTTDKAILYLTDIFGLPLVNNRLLGDSMARAGYHVIMPDLFAGDAIPLNAMSGGVPGFNMSAWREKHTVAQVDAIVESTIKSMRGELGFKKIGAVGYCFGGKYVARFSANGKGLDAGFTAHPSGIETAELQAITAPISFAYGETDAANLPAKRREAEEILIKKNATYQTTLYAGAEHGFAVRTDASDPKKAFAQESAYFQAIRWFDAWVKA